MIKKVGAKLPISLAVISTLIIGTVIGISIFYQQVVVPQQQFELEKLRLQNQNQGGGGTEDLIGQFKPPASPLGGIFPNSFGG